MQVRNPAEWSAAGAVREEALLVVEFAFEDAESLVLEAAGVAPAQQLLALGVDHRAADL